MNNADRTESSATSQQQPRRRRPRRRSRSNQHSTKHAGGQQSGHQQASSQQGGGQQGGNQQKDRPTNANRNRRRRSGATAKGQKSKQTGTAKTGTTKSNTSKSGTSQARNQRRRGSAARRPSRRPAPARNANANRGGMKTSIETSAGGLVVSGLAEAVQPDGSVDLSRIYVALIGRLDRRGRLLWSMPKGHVEAGEAHDSTAEREVWEETGIHGKVLTELGVIDYWFVSDGTRIHKTVHHYLLRFVDGDLNDEDPEVTEVSWVPASTLVENLAYADERKLARRAHDLLPELAKAEKHAGRATPRS
ncbi:NUDIX hydrolase [Corynebacterium sp. H113]|uniref:NUDIX hydrolase n=1 Tax=Corynebacterium sp. H113 TaxID=3133419 RepID=UPI0030A5B64C